MQRSTALTLLAALTASGAARPAVAQPKLTPLTVGLTAKTANEWPEYIGEALGFYRDQGLDAQFIYAGSAAAGAQQLTAGSLDIDETSSTQMIEAMVGGAPIVAVGVNAARAPYLVLGKKGITSLAELRGKTIIIGGPNDITRVFMDKVLASANLKPADYTYTYAGATTARFAALVSGGVDAAILFPPFSYRAEGMGYPILADVTKFFPTFLFGAYCVRTDWGKSHGDLIVRFLKAYAQGIRWLYEPANKTRAIQILADATNTPPGDAQQTYDVFVNRAKLWPENPVITDALVEPVIAALVNIGDLKPPAPPPGRFYDSSYAERAYAQLRGGR